MVSDVALPFLANPNCNSCDLSEQLLHALHELRVHRFQLEMQNEELKRAREQADRISSEYFDFYNNGPAGHITSGPLATVHRVNNRLAQMLGVSVAEIVKRGLDSWTVEPDAFYLHTQRVLADSHCAYTELAFRRPDGHVVHLSLESLVVSAEPEGEEDHLRTVCLDITRQKEIEAMLQRSQRVESVGLMAGGVAHEFNNLLGAITASVEVVSSGEPSKDELGEAIVAVRQLVDRGGELVRQMLTFCREDNVPKTVLELEALVGGEMHVLRRVLPQNVDIRCRFSRKACRVFGNATQLRQVLTNLCLNAANAMEATGGTLDVSLSHASQKDGQSMLPGLGEGVFALLEVSDTGSGIESGQLNRVFDPFFTTRQGGTGLGLAVVHSIVEQHGGIIRVSSNPGKGTTFTLAIPIVGGVITRPPVAPPAQRVPSERLRILFVDDEPLITNPTKRLLEKKGFCVDAFTDSRAAMKAFEISPESFDLVITDLTMPELTGEQLAKQVWTMRPKLPIIIASGHVDNQRKVNLSNMGVHTLLSKPWQFPQLLEAIACAVQE